MLFWSTCGFRRPEHKRLVWPGLSHILVSLIDHGPQDLRSYEINAFAMAHGPQAPLTLLCTPLSMGVPNLNSKGSADPCFGAPPLNTLFACVHVLPDARSPKRSNCHQCLASGSLFSVVVTRQCSGVEMSVSPQRNIRCLCMCACDAACAKSKNERTVVSFWPRGRCCRSWSRVSAPAQKSSDAQVLGS